MKNWNNIARKRALQDAEEYRKLMQIAPAERNEKRLRALKRRLGL